MCLDLQSGMRYPIRYKIPIRNKKYRRPADFACASLQVCCNWFVAMSDENHSHLALVVDNTRRRRQVAVPQAAIARAVRAAAAAGPQWQVSIQGNVVRLFQGHPPPSTPPHAITSSVRDFSL